VPLSSPHQPPLLAGPEAESQEVSQAAAQEEHHQEEERHPSAAAPGELQREAADRQDHPAHHHRERDAEGSQESAVA